MKLRYRLFDDSWKRDVKTGQFAHRLPYPFGLGNEWYADGINMIPVSHAALEIGKQLGNLSSGTT